MNLFIKSKSVVYLNEVAECKRNTFSTEVFCVSGLPFSSAGLADTFLEIILFTDVSFDQISQDSNNSIHL